ncbi:MAG: hypothetical protein IJV40_08860 [Oscillospiraceae bacterium]|nr:hypothetical protein [Oscillospiraceae bacterium]
MFGYLTADRGHLTPEEDSRYRAAYCGLCRSLRSRWGSHSGLTLNYDQCFLILLLQSLYEAEEQSGDETCIAHPLKSHAWWQSRYTDYGADMNIALSYLKLRDNWEDDGSLAALTGSAAFRYSFEAVSARYPRQCEAMDRSIRDLRAIEKEKREDPDAAAETFAMMMAEVFVYSEDRWSAVLRQFGAALGRFLYIMDACVDLDEDAIRGHYNPFRRYYGLTDNGSRFDDILRMILGECLFYFDKLPLVTDAGILKNILCYGLWTQFDKKYNMSRNNSNGIESV